MPTTIKDKDGKEIEVFTGEETEARETAAAAAATKEAKEAGDKALEDYKAANPDKSGEITEVQKQLDEVNKKLVAAEKENNDNDASGQVARLREERDAAQKKLKEATDGFQQQFDTLRNEMVGDTKEEWLSRLSGGDAELRKKIELEFDSYNPTKTTKKDIGERMQKAFHLATGNAPSPTVLDSIAGGGTARGDTTPQSEKVKEATENEKKIGDVLGITDEDRKKHKGNVNSSTAD